MLLFDLDRFKEINDQLGHAVGDRVLQTFARPRPRTLGADVLFGRIGGEEFASLLPVGDLGEAFAIADRVRRNFAETAVRFANGDLTPTVSVGVTLGIGAKPTSTTCWRSPTGRCIAPRPTGAIVSRRPRRSTRWRRRSPARPRSCRSSGRSAWPWRRRAGHAGAPRIERATAGRHSATA